MIRFLFFFLIIFFCQQLLVMGEGASRSSKYKGYAILGNGDVCAVYSDDPRMVKSKSARGIQHFYYQDYTVDYLSSSWVEVIQNGHKLDGEDSLALADFFSTLTVTRYPNQVQTELRCFALPGDGIALQFRGIHLVSPTRINFVLKLREKFISDRSTLLASLTYVRHSLVAEWSNGVTILIAPAFDDGLIRMDDSLITIQREISGDKWNSLILIAGKSRQEVLQKWSRLARHPNFYQEAKKYWNAWLKKGLLPSFKKDYAEGPRYLEMFKRNLYAVKAANLNGQIPADITGQFLTNNMPQLYPRDAMMCARVFLLTGHLEEARQIIEFWNNPALPLKHRNEFYARYDAYGQAVDAGRGARYDEPEWDSNGYFIQLVYNYFQKTGKWLTDKKTLYEFASYLVFRIDERGLLYEGGIVEWTGYLPATNMICAAALRTASQIATNFADSARAEKFRKASQTVSDSLYQLFDVRRNTYAALRYHTKKTDDNRSLSEKSGNLKYMWDTSCYYGFLWGYPDHESFRLTNQFILNHTSILGGGLQYFEADDNSWLSDYGDDAFFFPTAASAQYNCRWGDGHIAKNQIDWMINHSNSYGLMPERIFSDGSDCSEASPLSWCNAEFAAAVLEFSRQWQAKK